MIVQTPAYVGSSAFIYEKLRMLDSLLDSWIMIKCSRVHIYIMCVIPFLFPLLVASAIFSYRCFCYFRL